MSQASKYLEKNRKSLVAPLTTIATALDTCFLFFVFFFSYLSVFLISFCRIIKARDQEFHSLVNKYVLCIYLYQPF